MDKDSMAARLKAAREAVRPKLSQSQVARALGVNEHGKPKHVTTISKWEKAEDGAVPDAITLAKLAKLYGVSMETLVPPHLVTLESFSDVAPEPPEIASDDEGEMRDAAVNALIQSGEAPVAHLGRLQALVRDLAARSGLQKMIEKLRDLYEAEMRRESGKLDAPHEVELKRAVSAARSGVVAKEAEAATRGIVIQPKPRKR
jgi:transcriptional regulator with XRE-family HTH domain